MYIYTPMFDRFNNKLAQLTGINCSAERFKGEQPTATLIVRKNSMGGVNDPSQYITDPNRCLVIPGTDNEAGFNFADIAISLGVPEDNLLFIPAGQKISIQQIAEKLMQIVNNAPADNELQSDYWGEIKAVQRIKVISFIGSRGGVGRTTIAMSLAAHYREINQTVAVLDLGSPAAAYRHTGLSLEMQDGLRFLQSPFCDVFAPVGSVWNTAPEIINQLVSELRAKYRRVIVDLPAEIPEGILKAVNSEKVIAVMDYDIPQAVEPLIELNEQAIFVYNKAVPEVDIEVVRAFVGSDIIMIRCDIDGCQAGLSSGEPAYHKSDVIAQGIGELAAVIDS